jgi:hypothetical protein
VGGGGEGAVQPADVPLVGGAGPTFWRQATAATRSLSRLTGVLFLLQLPVLATFFSRNARDIDAAVFGTAAFGMLAGVALFAPTMVVFDFRIELDRMEELKTLPCRSSCLVIGQLMTPVLILVAGEWLTGALVGYLAEASTTLLAGFFSLIVPLNVILVAIENLCFLLYPTRVVAGPAVDFQTMGRQVLLGLAKLVGAGVLTGLATAVGAAAFFVSGRSWTAAVAAAWLTLAGGAAGLIPLLVLAFDGFDVARDTPV